MKDQQLFCARHPQVETMLRCGKCDALICSRCLVHTPVGARCRDCAQLRSLPVFEVSPAYYTRAVMTGMGLAGVLGVLYSLLAPAVFSIPFLGLIAVAGLGYVVGGGISIAVNRKRGRGLQVVAGGATLLTYVVGSILTGVSLFASPFGLLAAIAGVYVATTRFQ